MLEPWSVLPTVALPGPGGVLTVYVPTTTQLSRIAEDIGCTEASPSPRRGRRCTGRGTWSGSRSAPSTG